MTTRLGNWTPWIIGVLTALAFVLLESFGMHLAGPTIPMSWGLAKDVLDAAILFLFPWNGWVFLCPLVAGIAAKWGISKFLLLWLTMSVAIGVEDTLISFDHVSLGRLLKGVGFYSFVFAVLSAVVLAINLVIDRRVKCRQ